MLQAQSSIIIKRPVEEVFQFVAQDFFENYPKWDPAVADLKKTSIEPVAVGTTGWQVMQGRGWRAEADFHVEDYEPNRRFSITGKGQGYFKNTYTFEPVGDHTKLTYDFEFGVQKIGRLFAPLMAGAVKKSSQETVENLQALLESR